MTTLRTVPSKLNRIWMSWIGLVVTWVAFWIWFAGGLIHSQTLVTVGWWALGMVTAINSLYIVALARTLIRYRKARQARRRVALEEMQRRRAGIVGRG